MRVALAALLFSAPDLLLLDEPSNHLDLEATLWLENFLKSYPGTLIVISHERDLLNNVVDHILHLQGGKMTLYAGGYDASSASAPNARRSSPRPRPPGCAARAAAGLCRAQFSARLDRQAGAVAREDAREDAADRRADGRSDAVRSISRPRRTAPAADHARSGRGRLWRNADPEAAQPADRSRRPDRAARPQRQRQDHAGAAARGAAGADGRAR